MLPILAVQASALQILWFVLVLVLWLGFFFLEGFDYGVAMLLPILGKDDKGKRVMINSIGPVWDGNEVWLLTAGGATFAAFPGWYATEFSALYLPLFLVLLGLILRGVSFEYRGKRDDASWRNAFDWCATIGCFITSLVFGVGFANFVIGLPVGVVDGKNFLFTGTFLGLFSPFGLLGGVLFVVLFATHGALFLALKTTGEVRERAKRFGFLGGVASAALLAIFVLWAQLGYAGGQFPILQWLTGILAVALLAGAALISKQDKDGLAFLLGGLSIVMLIVTIFLHMWPNLGFDNSTNQGKPLDVTTASSSPMTLTIMTIAAVIFVPIVLAYQAWTYWVFRRRVSSESIPVYPAAMQKAMDSAKTAFSGAGARASGRAASGAGATATDASIGSTRHTD